MNSTSGVKMGRGGGVWYNRDGIVLVGYRWKEGEVCGII